MERRRVGVGRLAASLVLSGCVSPNAYDKAAQDAQGVRARAAQDVVR